MTLRSLSQATGPGGVPAFAVEPTRTYFPNGRFEYTSGAAPWSAYGHTAWGLILAPGAGTTINVTRIEGIVDGHQHAMEFHRTVAGTSITQLVMVIPNVWALSGQRATLTLAGVRWTGASPLPLQLYQYQFFNGGGVDTYAAQSIDIPAGDSQLLAFSFDIPSCAGKFSAAGSQLQIGFNWRETDPNGTLTLDGICIARSNGDLPQLAPRLPLSLIQAESGGAPGGSAPAVQDEGAGVVAAASTLNFVGPGVTVTNGGGGIATVTIPGITVGATAPAGPVVGQLWVDTSA
jgi:hypothetical protein